MSNRTLIIVAGQEGAGKSTIVRALLAQTPNSARIDAEDVGQVNPWEMNEQFIRLLWNNVLAVISNFWAAGYGTVIAGSFLSSYHDYMRFRRQIPADIDVYIVHLCASKAVRDHRRIERPKPSSQEWRDQVDKYDPEDTTLIAAQSADYRYIRIENDAQSVDESVAAIKDAIPEVYGVPSQRQ